MDSERRRRLADAALEGYANGPDAPIEASAKALDLASAARAVVLVEGISDQIALETLATRHERDLRAEGIVVIPMGGAHAIARYLHRFGPRGAGLAVVGLCDAGEEVFFRRGLAEIGREPNPGPMGMDELGFFICHDDLEDELIRASDRFSVEALLDSQGDLGSFRTLQKQPAWRHEDFGAQIHRWLRAGAGRNLRYARLLVGCLQLDRIPRPLKGLLAATAAIDPEGPVPAVARTGPVVSRSGRSDPGDREPPASWPRST